MVCGCGNRSSFRTHNQPKHTTVSKRAGLSSILNGTPTHPKPSSFVGTMGNCMVQKSSMQLPGCCIFKMVQEPVSWIKKMQAHQPIQINGLLCSRKCVPQTHDSVNQTFGKEHWSLTSALDQPQVPPSDESVKICEGSGSTWASAMSGQSETHHPGPLLTVPSNGRMSKPPPIG